MQLTLKIIKIGGNIIDDEQGLASFLQDFARLPAPKILVHGGGKSATKLSEKLGETTEMIDGRRITSSENLDTVIMVYAGLINKQICASLQAANCNAIGLTGADANSIQSAIRPTTPINYGWVGDIEEVNTKVIQLFLNNNITPVFCAIGHDGKGQLLNTNADTVAAEIATAMSAEYDTELIYCFEMHGVRKDINDPNSIITNLDKRLYSELKTAGVIAAGMIPKIDNCFKALENNVSKVIIGNAHLLQDKNEMFTTLIA